MESKETLSTVIILNHSVCNGVLQGSIHLFPAYLENYSYSLHIQVLCDKKHIVLTEQCLSALARRKAVSSQTKHFVAARFLFTVNGRTCTSKVQS